MKVGDYIRTDEGIRKIIREYDIYYELDRSLHYMYPEGHDLNKEDVDDIVLKSSPNIIDLIEVGDYVNGEKVTDKFDYLLVFGNADYYKDENEIKSIVTKEAFENMEYKVGDE